GVSVAVPRGNLHVARVKFLQDGVCYETIRIRNYGLLMVEVRLSLHFEADFADIFEVRGTRRKARGQRHPGTVIHSSVVLPYTGLDGVERRTRIDFSPAPEHLTPSSAVFHVMLPPQGEAKLNVTASCEVGSVIPQVVPFEEAIDTTCKMAESAYAAACT